MTVRELIEHLSTLAPELKVVAWDDVSGDYEAVTDTHAEGEFVWLKTEVSQ